MNVKLKDPVCGFPVGAVAEVIDEIQSPDGKVFVQLEDAETILQKWVPVAILEPAVITEEGDRADAAASAIIALSYSVNAGDAKEIARVIRGIYDPVIVNLEVELADCGRLRRKWRDLCIEKMKRLGEINATETRPKHTLDNLVSILQDWQQFNEDRKHDAN